MPRAFVRRFLADDDGATAIEYALIITFIALVVFAAMGLVFTAVVGKFNMATNSLTGS